MENSRSIIEAWAYRSVFNESASWIADAFARENEALTKALQISLSDDSSASETLPPFPPTAVDSQSVATPAKHSRRSSDLIARSPLGKISKRKSRASKRSPTTYINADPSNFRQMVQEVTGIRLGDAALPAEQVARTAAGRGVQQQGYLPTLDTSAVLFDRACGSLDPILDGPAGDFKPFPSFPTLESWGM